MIKINIINSQMRTLSVIKGYKSSLKFDEHIDITINKVNRIIGLIKRKFKFIDKDYF